MISNLRTRVPGIQFLGITLNCDNFIKHHGVEGFPLLAVSMPLEGSLERASWQKVSREEDLSCRPADLGPPPRNQRFVQRVIRSIPGLVSLVKAIRNGIFVIRREFVHSVKGYRILRTQDLLLFSGGGQLDEEYGGAWRLPFAYFKWALLARLARVPCAMASIGAGSLRLPASRRFVSLALRMCCYRSFRETRSRGIAAGIWPKANRDVVVPDLAFSLPNLELPPAVGSIRRLAHGRSVVALSPICYMKPGNWPTPNRELYDRYVSEMAQTLTSLTHKGYFVVIVCSSLGDDESVIPELLDRLEEGAKANLDSNVSFPAVKSWRELVGILQSVDFLVASRLHGTILGFVTSTPVIAISFDPKVDWVMEDLRQTDYLLRYRDFTAGEVIARLKKIECRKSEVVSTITDYRKRVLSTSDSSRQFDFLSGIASQHCQSHS